MATKNITTQIIINAAPQHVWQVFTQFGEYPKWNSFVHSLEGVPVVGQKIKVSLPGMKFTPEVLAYTEDSELRWKGKLFLKGLFDGEHYFLLHDNGDGTTTFVHGENFSGLLVPLFNRMLETKTRPGFMQMNEELKKRVESAG